MMNEGMTLRKAAKFTSLSKHLHAATEGNYKTRMTVVGSLHGPYA
jgi:hypothetical protein